MSAPLVLAQPLESEDAIKAAVQVYIESHTAHLAKDPLIEVGRLDPRLRLPACEAPLKAFLPSGGRLMGNVTVGVRCPSPKPWSLYVQAAVRMMDQVVVAARPLPRGTVLQAGDLEVAERDVSRLTTGYVSDIKNILGKSLKRRVRAGMALAPRLVAAPVVIHRGDRVSIKAAASSLEVRVEGVALEDGAKGASIRVRNLSSKREIGARVVGPGVVAVQL